MKPASKKVPAVQTVKVGDRTMIVRASLFDALGIPDPLPQADRPVTVTHRQVQDLTNLSKSTIDRMIFAGRQAEQAEAA